MAINKSQMTNYLISIILGITSFLFAWSCWHLYVDHQIFHALMNNIQQSNQNQTQQPNQDNQKKR